MKTKSPVTMISICNGIASVWGRNKLRNYKVTSASIARIESIAEYTNEKYYVTHNACGRKIATTTEMIYRF